jgi:arylsulfatase A-like enzyme
MHVPLYVRGPGVPVNQQTDALATHVDLAATVCGIAAADAPSVQGVSLEPVLADPAASVRDHVLFAMDSAHTTNIQKTRYALRGFFDGRTKYARYYGVGGGFPNDVLEPGLDIKLYPESADFDDQDHELYDLQEDPHELVNLAMDRGRRTEVRERFNQLVELETRFF